MTNLEKLGQRRERRDHFQHRRTVGRQGKDTETIK